MKLALPAFLNLKRLEGRIVAPFLALLAVVQLASWFITDANIKNSTELTVQAELQTGQRMFEHLLVQDAQQRTALLRQLENNHGIRDVLADAGSMSREEFAETLVSALDSKNRSLLKAGLIAYADGNAQVVAATAAEAQDFAALLPRLQKSMAQASEGKAPAWQTNLALVKGRAYQLVAVPVQAAGLGGWLLMAVDLQDEPLQELQALSQLHGVILRREQAQRPWQALGSVLDPRHTAAVAQQLQGKPAGSHLFALQLGAEEMRGLYLPLLQEGPQELAVVLLRSFDQAFLSFGLLRQTLAWLTLLGVAAFALGSVLTARRISEPISTLAESVERLGRGDYDTPVAQIKGAEEVSHLASAFEAMRQGIRQRDHSLNDLAFKDQLTELPNRAGFGLRVGQALAQAGADTPLAVLILGLDRFKHVNDVQGHEFGDLLLRKVAKRLQALLPGPEDGLARLSGDEFALLLRGANEASALALADAIRRDFENPLQIQDQTVDLSAGIGIALAPQHGREAKLLLARATLAMFDAKKRQSGSMVYSAQLDVGSQESLSLLGELRHAVEAGELRLYLQPKVDLARGRILSAEALLRWQHPERGLVPPMHFIPFAEQSGFIRTLTTWVIAAALRAWSQAQAQGLELRISVNLSTRDLLDQDLPAKIMGMLAAQGAGSQALCLEITESAIMDDPQRALHTLEQLSALGFKLSIDDFGTGYSSLAYLKTLPVDELKIDKSFVLAMERDLGDAKIVHSTIELAHNLGLSVVAEGVETAKAWKILAALGCDEGQGYFIAKPMPEAQFLDWLRHWQAPDLSSESADTVLGGLG
ncbi:diguanylate cyclase (GGDEF)-like protein [Paucibacter oligotrophus]|uniref:Diguanylate cyclase (GGDEF)-like protein n=1 Tax=Roseateles oligotrophus TaxID=1769250 RepID=A0A840L7U6_9BURK|nr:bifunctional diguanylate cyclase/phosphodiesterase [Roseateles oligotrophus]MBB4842843.1 diguanylate cyclase (GGDEF)-like protein [Roseateles oligotrophus]